MRRPDHSHHAGCVWDVAFLPNGDLVTACADYAARVWTQAKDNAAAVDMVEVSLKMRRND